MRYALAVSLVFLLNFNIAKAQEDGFNGWDKSETDGSGEVSTLESALTETYRTNPEIRRARAGVESASELRAQALSGFLPTVSANVDYGRQHTEFGGVTSNGNTGERTLTAEQPLLRGGNFSRMDQSTYQAQAAMHDLNNTESEIFLAAISAYMNLVTDVALLDLSHKKEAFLYRQYDETNKRFKGGELTKTDVSQSISRSSSAAAETANAESNYAASRANFERVIGRVPGTLTIPADLPSIPSDVAEALRIARDNNPGVKASEAAGKAADEAIEANKGALLPTLSLRGRLDRQDNYALANNGDYADDSVTLNLSIPLYQAGAEYSRVRQAKAEASARKYDYFSRRQRVEQDVKAAWQRIYTSKKTIDASRASVEAAENALEGVKKEEMLGTRTVLDVLDAEQELYAAKNGLLLAKRDQIIAYYTLEARIGKLTAKELALPVNFYDAEKHYDKVKNQVIGF